MSFFKPLSFAFSLLLLGCVSNDGGGVGGDGGNSCSGAQTRCSNGAYQECNGGRFKTQSVCAGSTVCSESLGCVECRPEESRVCVGDTVRTCNANGNLGDAVEVCPFETCFDGSCGGGNSNCDASGTNLVYVVDDASNLLSFDPSKLATGGDPFTRIGRLSCPAGAPLGVAFGASTPFSMSVDRNGTAWVLYSSGEIFHVSTTDASCQTTNWVVGTNGFELFGMGFVSDAAGSNEETLFISGGSATNLVDGNLATVNPGTLAVNTLGRLPAADQSPELTGTGDAKLYGYFPGDANTFVANLDKSNGTKLQSWAAPSIPGGVSAWAFAQWGGRFYIFATGGTFVPTNAVYELNPMTGMSTKVIASSPYRVVGAGVSTCAPTQID